MFTKEVLNFETVERMPCGTVRLAGGRPASSYRLSDHSCGKYGVIAELGELKRFFFMGNALMVRPTSLAHPQNLV